MKEEFKGSLFKGMFNALLIELLFIVVCIGIGNILSYL